MTDNKRRICITKAARNSIAKLIKEGKNIPEISRILDIPESRIERSLRKNYLNNGLLYEDEYSLIEKMSSRRISINDMSLVNNSNKKNDLSIFNKNCFDYVEVNFPLLSTANKNNLNPFIKDFFRNGYLCCERYTGINRHFFKMSHATITKEKILHIVYELKELKEVEDYGYDRKANLQTHE